MAASKVNVKFVVLLSAVLGMVFVGVALSFVYIKLKSGERYARLADAALAEGDINKADLFLGRAVGKDQSRVDWLTKWRDTRRKKVPETQSNYSDDYQMYVSILRTLANAKRTDVALHRDYLEELYVLAAARGADRDSWRHLIRETEAAMRFFDPERPAALRRYRGVAIVALNAIGSDVDVSDSEINEARDDLEAAVKANPADEIAANHLAVWHRDAAKKALASENREAAMAELALARAPIDGLLAASPGNPFGLVAKLTMEAADVDLLTDPKKSAAELKKLREEALDRFKPRVKELGEQLAAADPAKLELDTVSRFANLAMGIDPKDGLAMVLKVVDRAMQAKKDDTLLMSIRSQMLSMSGDTEGAIAGYQAIIDSPTKPVSWEGLRQFEMRRGAMFQQTNLAMAQALRVSADRNASESDKKAAMARVNKFREVLARNVAEHAPELFLVDGKLKYLERDLRGAQRLLADFVRTPGSLEAQVPEARLLAAEIATQLGQVGLAIDELEKVRLVRPTSIDILLSLAGLYSQVQQSEKAAAMYTEVLRLDPENEQAKKNLSVVRAIEDTAAPKLDDPVIQLLVEAERLQRGTSKKLGDEQAAIDLLERGIETTGGDPRIALPLARMKVLRNDMDGAKATLKAALAKRPDDATLKDFMSRLESVGTLEGVLALIDTQAGEPIEKLWAKRQTYISFGKQAEANAALAEFIKLAPNDSRAIEAQFLAALTDKKFDEAQRLTDLAVQTDADRAGGDTYRARLLLAKGNLQEACAVLERATQGGNSTSALLQMLGRVQLQLGREQGLSSIKRALELNPTDLSTVKLYLGALLQFNRKAEALTVARDSRAFAQRDPEFLNAWLTLEATAGNRALALDQREQIQRRDAADVVNGVALAELYIDAKDWDKARSLIDKLRVGNEASIPVATADARWYADKGDLDNAGQVFVKLIEAVGKTVPAGKEMPPDSYVVFGQFMIQHGRLDMGLAALRQAERLQNPVTMDVSMLLGNVLLTKGRYTDAEEVFRKLIEAKVPDPRHDIVKRLIETYLQLQRLDDVEAEFVKLGAAADDDPELMSQRAFAARSKGDLKRAREILDRAVLKFPSEPLPYVRRARLLMLEPNTVRDALADLDTAVKIRPAMWQARRTRGMLLLGQGQIDLGIKDLMAAVESAPNLDSLRMELIDTLLKLGREPEALDVADAGLKPRPSDVALIGMTADRFAAAGRWARAVRYYKMLWQQVGDEASALMYTNALLNSTPPGLTEAEAVLATEKLNTDRSVDLLMARASLRRKQSRESDAKRDALLAFDRSLGGPAMLAQWASRLRKPFPEPRAALAVLQAAPAPPAIADWMTLQRGTVMLEDAAMQSEGVSLLEGLLANSTDRDVKIEACRELPQAYQADKKYQEALDVSKRGLTFKPDDVMFINNAAYFLSEGLGNPKDALPYAERAAQLAPNDDRILDTLAGVNWRLGNRDKAMQIEADSFRQARSEADKASRALTLANWRLEAKDKTAASGLLATLREMLSDSPSLGAAFKTKIDDLERAVQGAP